MKASKSLCLQCLFTCLLLFIAARVKADDSGILDRIIRLPKSEMTVYKLLSKITEETGYLFIYDSKLVDNERTVKLKGGKQTVRQAIYSIIGNDNLKLRSVDKHIIIYRPETALSISKEEGLCRDSTLSFTLEGTLIDQLPDYHKKSRMQICLAGMPCPDPEIPAVVSDGSEIGRAHV